MRLSDARATRIHQHVGSTSARSASSKFRSAVGPQLRAMRSVIRLLRVRRFAHRRPAMQLCQRPFDSHAVITSWQLPVNAASLRIVADLSAPVYESDIHTRSSPTTSNQALGLKLSIFCLCSYSKPLARRLVATWRSVYTVHICSQHTHTHTHSVRIVLCHPFIYSHRRGLHFNAAVHNNWSGRLLFIVTRIPHRPIIVRSTFAL